MGTLICGCQHDALVGRSLRSIITVQVGVRIDSSDREGNSGSDGNDDCLGDHRWWVRVTWESLEQGGCNYLGMLAAASMVATYLMEFGLSVVWRATSWIMMESLPNVQQNGVNVTDEHVDKT